MLQSLRIQNYRGLQDVSLAFTPLTVLVGPNGSGKTSLLRALAPTLLVQSHDLWQHRPNTQVTRSGQFRDVAFQEQLGNGMAGSLPWTFSSLQLNPAKMRPMIQVEEGHALSADGQNLTNVFATLARASQGSVVTRLCDLVPLYRDVSARPSGGGSHRLVFQDRFSDTWFEPHEVSDGTILLLAFITLTHLENPPDILAIEHPEEGIHPYLCQQVMDMLRDMAHGKLGPKPVQVVVSTHSPVLLNFVKPEEVRFCSRDLETGNTLIREAPKDHAEWKATFQEYGDQMGEMWLAGSLGGVPGSSAAQ